MQNPLDYLEPTSNGYMAHRKWFSDILEHKDFEYGRQVDEMLRHNEQKRSDDVPYRTRLLVDLNHLGAADAEGAPQLKELKRKPIEFIGPMQAALEDFVRSRPGGVIPPKVKFVVGFKGPFGAHGVTPRQLNAEHMGE